jgi:caa(3)-type oxidase subunit IV
MDETHQPIAAETVAGDSSHEEHGAHDVAKHVRTYLMVGATLIVFTAITVFLSYVNFGTQKANVAVAMLVATFKAGLVAAIFMHLSSEKRIIYRILIFTFFFVLGLFWLTYLAWYDPITR